jgi:HK97 family phage prohead protease
VKHLFNHDPGQPLGKIMELEEDSYGLKYVSKVGTHSLGRDFIKMVESGLITEHSIGFRTLREQKGSGSNEIYDVMLFEGSSLSAWGANMETPLIGMKSEQTLKQLQDQIKSFENFIRNCDVSEETVDLCLIKVKQLAQAIEHMSSTEAAIEAPLQQKDDELEQSLINILNKI